MFSYANLKNSLKYRYNLNYRNFFGRDLNLIEISFKEKYSLYPCVSYLHIINALKCRYYTNYIFGSKWSSFKFSVGAVYGLGYSYPETIDYTICTF